MPKYRFRIFSGKVVTEIGDCVRAVSEQKECEIIELDVQVDHVDLLVMVPPKISISDYVGMIKGRTAIRMYNKFKKLKSKPYLGNTSWSRGYSVDTVRLDSDMIRKYVRHQEEKERREVQDHDILQFVVCLAIFS